MIADDRNGFHKFAKWGVLRTWELLHDAWGCGWGSWKEWVPACAAVSRYVSSCDFCLFLALITEHANSGNTINNRLMSLINRWMPLINQECPSATNKLQRCHSNGPQTNKCHRNYRWSQKSDSKVVNNLFQHVANIVSRMLTNMRRCFGMSPTCYFLFRHLFLITQYALAI